jgi:hypothetical protein
MLFQFVSDGSVYSIAQAKYQGKLTLIAECLLSETKTGSRFPIEQEHIEIYERHQLIKPITDEQYQELKARPSNIWTPPEQVQSVPDTQGERWEALFG